MKTLSWILASSVLTASVVAGCADDSAESSPALAAPSETGVAELRLRRLSTYEYDQTVFDLLGDDQVSSAAFLPPDLPSPYDNDYVSQLPSRALVDGADGLARDIALRLLAEIPRRDEVVGCMPTGVADEACLAEFVRTLGRRALRRPLSDAEIADLVELGMTYATQEDDFYVGVELIVRAMLQDVAFLYRVEIGTPVEGHAGVFKLNSYEIATRLSYLLWGTTPSDALLDLADKGGLDTQEGVIAAARELLGDDKARRQVDRFHALWLGYDSLPHPAELTGAMRNETRALLERVVFDKQAPWTELFTSKETYVDDMLAAHYDLPLPGGEGWMDYSADGRRGLLSHGSFLSVAGNVGFTSPVRRGVHILERVTCQVVPPPPPDVDTQLPKGAGECKLDQIAAHAQGGCAACHNRMDPIGLGLEQYDVAGRFRTFEAGKPQCEIDGEGELVGVGKFNGPAELGARLVESGLLEGCVVQHLVQYAIGRELEEADEALIAHLSKEFTDSGRFDELVIALVSDESFFFRREGAE